MSRLEEIQDEYAREIGSTSWNGLVSCVGNKTRGIYEQKVAKRYATECVKASLEEAYKEASLRLDLLESCDYEVLNKSITNPDNIVIL